MNKSKLVFIGTFAIMVAFILTLSIFYSRAIKKKLHFEYQLGEEIAAPKDKEPDSAAVKMNFNESGSRLITLLNNGNIDIWDLSNQKKTVSYSTDSVFSYCRVNDYIIVSDKDDIFYIDVNNGEKFRLTGGKYNYSSIDDNCDKLALAGQDNKIEIWNLVQPGIIATISTSLPVRNGLDISPDGSLVAAAEGIYHEDENRHETMIEMWKLDLGKTYKLGSVKGYAVAGVWNLFFSPENSSLIFDTQLSAQSGVAISDLEGNTVFDKSEFDSFWTRAIAVSPDGNILATGDEKGNLVLWNLNTKEIKSYYRLGDVIESLAFSKNGSLLAAGLANSTIQVFQMIRPEK